MKKAQKGFTLAEVLIALVLLGIVAAFTIPKLIVSVGDRATRAAVRQSWAVLQGAYKTLSDDPETQGGTRTVTIYSYLNPLFQNATLTTPALAAVPNACKNATGTGGVFIAAQTTTTPGLAAFSTHSIYFMSTGATAPNVNAAAGAGNTTNICIAYGTGATLTNATAGTTAFGGQFNTGGDQVATNLLGASRSNPFDPGPNAAITATASVADKL